MPVEITMAAAAIRGTRAAGRQRRIHAQKVFRERGLAESELEIRLCYFYDDWGLAAIMRSRACDILTARRDASSAGKTAISSLETKLHQTNVEGIIMHGGRSISASDAEFRISQATAATQVDDVELMRAKRQPDDRL